MIDIITISAWLVNEINNSTFSRKERQRYTNTFNELGVFVVVVVVVVVVGVFFVIQVNYILFKIKSTYHKIFILSAGTKL